MKKLMIVIKALYGVERCIVNKKYKGLDRRKKRISGRKVLSFIVNNIELMAIYFVTLIVAAEILKIIGTIVILAIIINTAIFIGGNTIDKLANLKFFGKDQ